MESGIVGRLSDARSLPWDGSRGWSGDLPDYKLEKLIADIETLLTPSTPVIAAALIASDRDRSAYQQHAEKARQGVTKDALLARNIDHIS